MALVYTRAVPFFVQNFDMIIFIMSINIYGKRNRIGKGMERNGKGIVYRLA